MASITKTINGTWRVQLEHRGKREYRTFRLKTHAAQYAIQREAEFQTGQLANTNMAQKHTLAHVIKTYREKVSVLKRGNGDASALNALNAGLGKTRLISLTTMAIANYRDDRLGNGKAPATVVKELNLLRCVIDYAMRDMGIYLASNLARLVKNPSVSNSRDRVFHDGEEELFFAPMDNKALKAICLLALETACRLGELLSLTWEHVNLDRRIAHIAYTKTDTPRTIPLSAEAIEILRQLKPDMKPKKRSAATGPIFTNWQRSDSFTKTFRRAVEKARAQYETKSSESGAKPDPRILQDIRFHDFRHIATSRLAQLIPNVIELSRITGHTDLRMLSRYYHIAAEDLAEKLSPSGELRVAN